VLWEDSSPDPHEVAEVVFEAVYDAEPRFRYVVGQLALELARIRQAAGFEGVLRALQERLSQPA
jgi:hypothetical protein